MVDITVQSVALDAGHGLPVEATPETKPLLQVRIYTCMHIRTHPNIYACIPTHLVAVHPTLIVWKGCF